MQAFEIPTYPDLLHRITADMAESLDEEAAAIIANILLDPAPLVGRLFNQIAHARGCHAAAEVRRREGNEKGAAFLYDIGQVLLEAAGETYAELVAGLVNALEVKH